MAGTGKKKQEEKQPAENPSLFLGGEGLAANIGSAVPTVPTCGPLNCAWQVQGQGRKGNFSNRPLDELPKCATYPFLHSAVSAFDALHAFSSHVPVTTVI